jgi:hypothetical protein
VTVGRDCKDLCSRGAAAGVGLTEKAGKGIEPMAPKQTTATSPAAAQTAFRATLRTFGEAVIGLPFRTCVR